MQQKQYLIGAALFIIVGCSAFFGGMKYGQSIRPGGQGQFQGRVNSATGAGNFAPRTGQASGLVTGEVISKDEKSVTVKMRDGSTKIVFFSGSTSVGKTVDGTSGDLTVGQQVMINGPANSDGSVTAQFIQIRPATPPEQPPSGAPTNTAPDSKPVPL